MLLELSGVVATTFGHALDVLPRRERPARVHAQERDTRRQADRISAPSTLLSGRQILKAPHHMQAAFRIAAHAEAEDGLVTQSRVSDYGAIRSLAPCL